MVPHRVKKTISLLVLLTILAISQVRAADPVPNFSRGQQMLEKYFRHQVRQIADACLTDIKSKEEWEKRRPELRRQFLEMMGLWPLPARTDLNAVVTGKVDAENFTIEKLHFQSVPGLYVTANLYVPKKTKLPAPTVLYVCGHSNEVINNVSYGSKLKYQHHPTWFAEHGYVCLILDTLELGESQGIHHGSFDNNMWWWQTLGYTPAGVECWNAMRALDYLETRPEVDRKRIGVTGRSGGGATSWWLAAADDRPQCIVPVAGIADLHAHVVEGIDPHYRHGVINGHCDCMYFVNTYRWDFPMVAALAAPRPLMLGNSNADGIFPVPGYRGLVEKVRRIYDLCSASDKFVVVETPGPHKDTADLRLAAYRWMNYWLKEDSGDTSEPTRQRFPAAQLKVFDRIPDDAANATIHETFVRPAHPEMPQVSAVVREWWPGQRQHWMDALRNKVFHGWPENPPPLNARPQADIHSNGLRLRAFDFTSEQDIELRLWLLTADKTEKPTITILTALDETGWREWLRELGPSFQNAFPGESMPPLNSSLQEQDVKTLGFHNWAFAMFAPRGIGLTRIPPLPTGPKARNETTDILRRFALIGQTLDGQRVWDVRRAIAVLRSQNDLKDVPLWLQGDREMAGIVLYAALFEPEVARLDLWHLPLSHRQGPIFLNVRRFWDIPQAVALAFPRTIHIYTKEGSVGTSWKWPLQLQEALGAEYLKVRQIGE
jgi:dienelactone hydrolase